MIIMLCFGQYLGKFHLMVVKHQKNYACGLGRSLEPFPVYEGVPEHVPDSFGPVSVPILLHHEIEIIEQVFIKRNTEPFYHRSILSELSDLLKLRYIFSGKSYVGGSEVLF
jgi:hypothetical protein